MQPDLSHIKGPKHYGAPEVLLDQDDNLIARTSWREQGYTVQPFLKAADYTLLSEGINDIMRDALESAGIPVPRDFRPDQYHTLTGKDPQKHAVVIGKTRLLDIDHLPVPVQLIEASISEICQVSLTAEHPDYQKAVFHLRIIRPESGDNNPMHKDVWLDRLRNAVNIYVPLAGSNERSSLRIVPGSHLWPESEIERTEAGAMINGISYTVPAVTGAKRPLQMIRPNPAVNEVLVFSPYLIHGGATNLNPDKTRVSLEMRFWRKKGG